MSIEFYGKYTEEYPMRGYIRLLLPFAPVPTAFPPVVSSKDRSARPCSAGVQSSSDFVDPGRVTVRPAIGSRARGHRVQGLSARGATGRVFQGRRYTHTRAGGRLSQTLLERLAV